MPFNSTFLFFYFFSQFLVSKYLRQSHHLLTSKNLSEAFSIVYNPEKFRIWDSRVYIRSGLVLENTPDLRYLVSHSSEPSIVKLRNLEYLRLKYVNELPTYLLNMPKLRHLYVDTMGGVRFTKNCDSSPINCLQTLGCVRISDSEDEEILRCSPNLRTLKCRLSDNHFPDLNFLSQLESLNISINRESGFNGDYSVVKFPMNIKKLTLSGNGLPYEEMSLIGKLPNLEILKLEHNKSKGKIWDTKADEFKNLKFLKLAYLKLEHWNSSKDHFSALERLVLRGCKDLEMIPSEFSMIYTLQKIVVYNCCKNVQSSALEIQQEQQDYGNEEFDVTISEY